MRRRAVLQTTTDDRRRRQTPASITSLAPYTMCRRASNNKESCYYSFNDHLVQKIRPEHTDTYTHKPDRLLYLDHEPIQVNCKQVWVGRSPVTLKVTPCDGEDTTPSTLLVAVHSTVSVRPTHSRWTTNDLHPEPDFSFLSSAAGLSWISGTGFPRALQRSSSPATSDGLFGVNFTSIAPSAQPTDKINGNEKHWETIHIIE